MRDFLLHNARVVLSTGVIHGGVLVRNAWIAAVFAEAERPTAFAGAGVIDLDHCYLAPGFIDLHIHGSAGVDVQNTDLGGLQRLSRYLLDNGVTGYFPTFVPTGMAEYKSAIAEIEAGISQQQTAGKTDSQEPLSQILGVHFEGPFVNERRRGALNSRYFQTYDGDIRSIAVFTTPLAGNLPRLMTVAPEVEGGVNLCSALNEKGIRPFVGHSAARLDLLDQAASRGATHITHFPNGLERLDHRATGVVGWGLLRDSVSVDCIADMHHVDAGMLQLIFKNKGPRRMALISDAIAPGGLGDGIHEVWGVRIAVHGGRATLLGAGTGEAPETQTNTIAGSVITLRDAVKNMTDIGVKLPDAVHMASLVPATIAGIAAETGSIETGKRADLIAFNDECQIKLALAGGLMTRKE